MARSKPSLLPVIASGSWLIACALGFASPAQAQWMSNGIPLVQTPGGGQVISVIATNGAHGAYVAWSDSRDKTRDVYLQHLTAAGSVAPGWKADGIRIAAGPTSQTALRAVADGSGGVFVIWTDLPFGGYDVLAQRVGADGLISPNWPLAGVVLSNQPGYQTPVGACSDDQGGLYAAWSDEIRSDSTITFVQRLGPDGVPAAGWPPGGRRILETPTSHSSARMVADGAGGFVIVVTDTNGTLPGQTIKGANYSALRVLPSGEVAPGWPANGVLLLRTRSAREVHSICSDGAGGAYFAWNDARDASFPITPFQYDIYAQHVLADGRTDPRWPTDGLPIAYGPSGQYDFALAADGEGGALFIWEDTRLGDWLTYAQRIRPDGTPAPGWAPNGNRVNTRPEFQLSPRLVPDGLGGFYAFWSMFFTGNEGIHVGHIDGQGQTAAGWSSGGEIFASGASYLNPISDGEGGVIASFERGGGGPGVWAHRIYGDGYTATRPTPILAAADGDRISLRWSIAGESIRDPRVERRTEAGEWTVVGFPTNLSPGLLEFIESGLAPGRYGYRLSFVDNGIGGWSEESWLDVTAGLGLALEGFRPNPAVGAASLVLSLPDDRPARIDLIDVRGRVVHSREVGSLGGGSHVVPLAADTAMPPGMYWIRLTHPERTLTAKGLVLR